MSEKNNSFGLLKKTLHDVEEAKRNLDYEVGTLLSRSGKIIKEYGGELHSIKVPYEDIALFEGNIFTHNHPGGRCFTQEDGAEFVNTRLYEARASTPQGTYYSIKESDGEINRSIASVMREERAGSYVQAVNILQSLNLDLNHLSGREHDNILSDIMGGEADKWLINNAAEFGYIYTKGEI